MYLQCRMVFDDSGEEVPGPAAYEALHFAAIRTRDADNSSTKADGHVTVGRGRYIGFCVGVQKPCQPGRILSQGTG